MTIADLGSLGEFFGAILLFASLIYLGIQIRQSNKTDKLNAMISFEDQYRDTVGFFAATGEIGDLMARGMEDLSLLSPAEIHVVGPRIYSLYRHAEIAWEQVNEGYLDAAVLERTMKVIAIYHNDKGAQQWFDGHGKAMLSAPFYQYVQHYFDERDEAPEILSDTSS